MGYKSASPKPGERFGGTLYRADTGYSHPRNMNAYEAVLFEQEDLGNDINFPDELADYVSKFKASDCIWMTDSPEAALRYGRKRDVAAYTVYDELCIGEDGDDGYLMLFDRR